MPTGSGAGISGPDVTIVQYEEVMGSRNTVYIIAIPTSIYIPVSRPVCNYIPTSIILSPPVYISYIPTSIYILVSPPVYNIYIPTSI